MSLTLTGVPSPKDQVESLRQELFAKNRQLNERDDENASLREEIRRLERDKKAMETGLVNLRSLLAPLHNGLKMVFGEFDGLDIPNMAPQGSQPDSVDPRKQKVWDSWKEKLGGKAAETIDVLLLHGEMNTAQLRVHLQCNKDYAYQVVSKLYTAGIIKKNGGKISLKEI